MGLDAVELVMALEEEFGIDIAETESERLETPRAEDIGCDSYWLELFGLPCPPPRLDITKDNTPDKFLLQWSSAYPEYRLQSINTFDGPSPHPFTNVASPPVLVGAKFIHSNTVAAPRQFFRLAK